MSIKKFPGAVISDVPVEPAGPYQDSAASGVWTLEQQAYWEAQGLWPVPGNPNPDLFIENLFSTYLYTGNGSTQTITNGIDLDGEGGLVWIKPRDNPYGATNHFLRDTIRGGLNVIFSNTTAAGNTLATGLTFNSNGFTTNSTSDDNYGNIVSWTFRKQPKFFDVVTYTGNFTAGREIAHNLGSVPGMIIIKSLTDDGYPWRVYHQSLGPTKFLALNYTNEEGDAVSANMWNSTAPTDSVFTLGNHITVNSSSPSTYVAYLFAHDAGGFGDDAEQNVISCGSFVAPSSGTVSVTLGYEPQWILFKSATSSDNWFIFDTMRGWTASGNAPALSPNLSNDESPKSDWLSINSTGFTMPTGIFASSDNIIYIAIRRGPMKTPEAGTEVFSPISRTGTGGAVSITGVGLTPDMTLRKRSGTSSFGDWPLQDRLRGPSANLFTNLTNDEASVPTVQVTSFDMDGATYTDNAYNNTAGIQYINYFFKRAPGFFDVVAYSGDNASSRNIAHNLSASPELIMLATRTTTNLWPTYHKDLPDPNPTYPSFLRLNTNGGINSSGGYYAATPTESVFTIGGDLNASGQSYIAYLFATVAGVSKVGSYTGTGADLNLDCGFSAGARFVLIKRTDSTGDWYVWDSARGIVAGNDPYLLLNSPAAEEPNTDYIDPLSSGFTVTSNASSTVNVDTGTYIFLAIA
jgi:hypothetical protein